MSEYEAGMLTDRRPTLSSGSKAVFAVAFVATTLYTLVFRAGLQFLFAAIVTLVALYLLIPYVLAYFGE